MPEPYLETAVACVRGAGRIIRDRFGGPLDIATKGERSSIVTDADVAAERWIVGQLRARHPSHAIIAEEGGRQPGAAEFTWVVDPLDGTSNFAAGVPWFGVQMALLERGDPVVAAMFLPCLDLLYLAAKGGGLTRNGERVHVTREPELGNVLCAFGLDGACGPEPGQVQRELFHRVVDRVRNVRATNSLVDFAYTLDGRFGACVNLNTKIWDIAPAMLMFPEAGGRFTDVRGEPIRFDPATDPIDRSYRIAAASAALHPPLIAALAG